MLPIEPADEIDNKYSVGNFPDGDETANRDGWGAFSGYLGGFHLK